MKPKTLKSLKFSHLKVSYKLKQILVTHLHYYFLAMRMRTIWPYVHVVTTAIYMVLIVSIFIKEV